MSINIYRYIKCIISYLKYINFDLHLNFNILTFTFKQYYLFFYFSKIFYLNIII